MTNDTEHSSDVPAAPPEVKALYFSASTLAFYDAAIWAHELPTDVVEIDRQLHTEILTALSEGLVLSADEDGHPAAAPPPPRTTEQLAASVRRDRDARISDVQWMVERHNSQLTLSATPTLSQAEYMDLLQYVQDLRDVPLQPEFPTEVIWPVPPAFVAG